MYAVVQLGEKRRSRNLFKRGTGCPISHQHNDGYIVFSKKFFTKGSLLGHSMFFYKSDLTQLRFWNHATACKVVIVTYGQLMYSPHDTWIINF